MINTSIASEIFRIFKISTKAATRISTHAIVQNFIKSKLDSASFTDVWKDKARDELVLAFDELGPFYVKTLQILLSQDISLSWLSRSFDIRTFLTDLPPLSFSEVEKILDREIPKWRIELKIEEQPIGSASIGQVHKATDKEGREWAVKILKPAGAKRLRETSAALEQLIKNAELFTFNFAQKKILRDFKMFLHQLKQETSFIHEKHNIEKAQQIIATQKSDLIAVPKLYTRLCTNKVLVMEYFEGFSLVDVLTEKVKLREKNRKELAHDLLSEILIQIFELGFFHADPHAGNIMVLKRGGLGLFDWGLVGQFEDSDRIFIATVLKSLITMDKERLVDALYELVVHQGQLKVTRDKVRSEIENILSKSQKKSADNKKTIRSIAQSIEICMLTAEKLKVELPMGLILMIKTLITVEGLAKNIDADISMLHAAIPVLLRTAKPSGFDYLKLLWKSPQLLKKII